MDDDTSPRTGVDLESLFEFGSTASFYNANTSVKQVLSEPALIKKVIKVCEEKEKQIESLKQTVCEMVLKSTTSCVSHAHATSSSSAELVSRGIASLVEKGPQEGEKCVETIMVGISYSELRCSGTSCFQCDLEYVVFSG